MNRAMYGLIVGALAVAAPRIAHADGPVDYNDTAVDMSALPLGSYVVMSRVDKPPCHDDTAVLGFRTCAPFAAWSINPHKPAIFIETGVIMRRFASLLDGQATSVSHGDKILSFRAASGRPPGPATGTAALDSAILSSIRVGASLPHGLFTALEVDLGGVTRDGATTAEAIAAGVLGAPDVKQQGGVIVDSLASLGIRGTSSFGALGVEFAAGVRTVSYSFDSQFANFAESSTITSVAAVAEARVRGEVWLGPWVSAGVTVGTSVLDKNAWMGGVYLGVHTRAFSGGL
jgi:hypothetical protein